MAEPVAGKKEKCTHVVGQNKYRFCRLKEQSRTKVKALVWMLVLNDAADLLIMAECFGFAVLRGEHSHVLRRSGFEAAV